jgi:hypothetical protein
MTHKEKREKQIQEIAEAFQTECHGFVKALIDNNPQLTGSGTYQDLANVWIFRKLAELTIDKQSREKILK